MDNIEKIIDRVKLVLETTRNQQNILRQRGFALPETSTEILRSIRRELKELNKELDKERKIHQYQDDLLDLLLTDTIPDDKIEAMQFFLDYFCQQFQHIRGAFIAHNPTLELAANIYVQTDNLEFANYSPRHYHQSIIENIVKHVSTEQEVLLTDSIAFDNTYNSTGAYRGVPPIYFILAVPIVYEGNMRAMLYVDRHLRHGAFTDEIMAIFEKLAPFMARKFYA